MFLCLKMMKMTIETFNNNSEYELHTSSESQLKIFKYSCENYYYKIIIISKQFFELLINQMKQLNSLKSSSSSSSSIYNNNFYEYNISDIIREIFHLFQTLFENSNPQILRDSNNNNNNNNENDNSNNNEYYMKIYSSWSNEIFNIMSYLVEIYNELMRMKDFDHIEGLFNLFIQLASAQGEVFKSNEYTFKYLQTLIQIYIKMISIENVEMNEGIVDVELQCGLYLSISEYVNKISNNFSVNLLTQIPEYENFLKSFIQMVITMWQLTVKSIESKNLNQFETYSQYNAECFEYNVNSLSHFLIYENSHKDPNIVNIAKYLFTTICQSMILIKINSIELVNEEYFREDIIDENLIYLGLIGRLCIEDSLEYLNAIHTSIISQFSLLTSTTVSESDTNIFWEKCYWLITFIMYLTTDECEGEIPLIPNLINEYSSKYSSPSEDKFVQFMNIIIKSYCDLFINPYLNFSDIVVQQYFKFLSRFLKTYFYCDLSNYCDAVSKNIVFSYGRIDDANLNIEFIDYIITFISKSLINFEDESISSIIINCLDSFLNNIKSIKISVVQLQSFQLLTTSLLLLFHSKTSQLTLNITVQRNQLKLKNLSDDSIAKLCKIIIPFYDENVIKQMVNHIILAFLEFYIKIENNNQFVGKNRDKLILYLTILPNMFEMKVNNFESVVLPLIFPVFEKLSTIINHFPSDELVLKSILRIYYSLLNNNFYSITPEQLRMIIIFLSVLFDQYVKNYPPTQNISKDKEFALYKRLKLIIKIENCLLENCRMGINDITLSNELKLLILKGFHIILLSTSQSLLYFSKLYSPFYSLIRDISQIIPNELLSSLSLELFKLLMEKIEFGLNSPSYKLVYYSLESFASILSCHVKLILENKQFVNQNNVGLFTLIQSIPNFFSYYLLFILHLMIKEVWSDSVIEPAANVILILIICDENEFKNFPKKFFNNEKLFCHEKETIEEFKKLLMNVELNLDKNNEVLFQENLKQFVWNIKSLL